MKIIFFIFISSIIKSPDAPGKSKHKGKFYTMKEIKTVEIPDFEFPGRIAEENWNSLFYTNLPTTEQEYPDAPSYDTPNTYVWNYPTSFNSPYANYGNPIYI